MLKKNYKRIFLLTLVVIMLVVPIADSNNFKYDARGRRDPFIPLIGQDKIIVSRLEDITSIEDVRLEGIALIAKGKNAAIINGEILRENDKVGEIEIKKITDVTVTLLIGKKEYNIMLPEEGGVKE